MYALLYLKGVEKMAIKKRDYTRNAYQKIARKANDSLRKLEKMGVTSDKMETLKNALELLNESINKKGRADRVYSGKNLTPENEQRYTNISTQIIEETKNIEQMLKSDDRQKQDDLSDQDYIDMQDTYNDFLNKSLADFIKDSHQLKDIYDIARKKGIHADQIEEIKQNILREIARENIINGRKIDEVNPDKLSEFMRNELYNL